MVKKSLQIIPLNVFCSVTNTYHPENTTELKGFITSYILKTNCHYNEKKNEKEEKNRII